MQEGETCHSSHRNLLFPTVSSAKSSIFILEAGIKAGLNNDIINCDLSLGAVSQTQSRSKSTDLN